MKIKTVGVVGCGLMGAGIAEVCAKAGCQTIVRELTESLLEKGLERIHRSLDKAVEKGKLAAEEREKALGRLTGTIALADLAACDLVIEAIVENLEEKRKTFATLDAEVQEGALFASNTSSLTITQLAAGTKRADRFVGLHFFNPVPVMKLVEVVRTLLTDDVVYDTAFEFCRSLGKEPIACRDNSGFIVNRLLVPYLLDAVRALEEGVGSVEDIDKGMQLGTGYLMTKDAVECGVVSRDYQIDLLEGRETMLTGRTVNLPNRWLDSAVVRKMIREELDLQGEDLAYRERKKKVEALGTPRLSAKNMANSVSGQGTRPATKPTASPSP